MKNLKEKIKNEKETIKRNALIIGGCGISALAIGAAAAVIVIKKNN